MTEQHRDVLDGHAFFEQRYREGVAEAMGVSVVHFGELEKPVQVSRPVRPSGLRLSVATTLPPRSRSAIPIAGLGESDWRAATAASRL